MDFLVYSGSLTMRIACPSPYSCYDATGKKPDHNSFSDVFSVFCATLSSILTTHSSCLFKLKVMDTGYECQELAKRSSISQASVHTFLCLKLNHSHGSSNHLTLGLQCNWLSKQLSASISEAAFQPPSQLVFPDRLRGYRFLVNCRKASWQLFTSSRVSVARAMLEQLASLPSRVTISEENKKQSICSEPIFCPCEVVALDSQQSQRLHHKMHWEGFQPPLA